MTDQPRSRAEQIAILEQLDRIDRSGALGGGERLPQLLRYIVREELEGRGSRIKSFTIATEALGRGADFDAQGDGIARAEMGRLRRSLAHYYAAQGRGDPVTITLAKGSYRPLISQAPVIEPDQPAAANPALPAGAAKRPRLSMIAAGIVGALALAAAALTALGVTPGPRWPGQAGAPSRSVALVVAPVDIQPDGPGQRALARGLQSALVARLAEAPWLTVMFADGISPSVSGTYRLQVTASRLDDRYLVRSFLTRPDGAVAWSATYEPEQLSTSAVRLKRELAAAIASDVGRGSGALMRDLSASDEGDASFSCLLAAHRYWRGYEAEDRKAALACLQPLIARDATLATPRAALALFLVEEARGLDGASRGYALARAASTLGAVPEGSPLGLTARMAINACKGDTAGVRADAERLLAGWPNDPALLGDTGSKLGLAAAKWERAAAAEARALTLDPRPHPWYPLASIVKALLDGRLQDASRLFAQTPQRRFATGLAVEMALGAALPDIMLIRSARAQLKQLGHGDDDSVAAMIEGECWAPSTRAAVAALIRRAHLIAPAGAGH